MVMGRKIDKANLSIESSRKALRAELKKKCNGKPITRMIPFTNDDVPKYLKWLEREEEKSRKVAIMVG